MAGEVTVPWLSNHEITKGRMLVTLVMTVVLNRLVGNSFSKLSRDSFVKLLLPKMDKYTYILRSDMLQIYTTC